MGTVGSCGRSGIVSSGVGCVSGDLGPRGPCVGMMAGPTSPFCWEGGLQAEAEGVWRALNALQRRLGHVILGAGAPILPTISPPPSGP